MTYPTNSTALVSSSEAPGVPEAFAPEHAPISPELVVRKVSRRLTWFLFILFVFSFLDRINIGFAGVAMSKDLHLTGVAFGLASTIFYIAYVLGGVPSNAMLMRVGPRRWMAVLMICWGIASTCTMFARDPTTLYVIRAFVGVTEAGFMPGMLYYLSCWFPSSHRARASSLFMVAMPITAMLGSLSSGYLLNLDGLMGLAGWQWLFALEGLPSVILGIVVFKYLDDKPAHATWLSAAEKKWLIDTLAQEKTLALSATVYSGVSIVRQVLNLKIIKFATVYFCLVTTMGMVNIWGPQILAAFNAGAGNVRMGVLAAVPQLVTVVAMIWLGSHSDRMRERTWHVFFPICCAAVGWVMTAYAGEPLVRLAGLCLASAGGFSASAILWTSPDQMLPDNVKAIGIAVISALGNVATALSSYIVGALKDVTHSFSSGLLYAAAILVIGAFVVLTIPEMRRSNLAGN
ncbi:MFS transporter [Glaciimonas sp. GG7]